MLTKKQNLRETIRGGKPDRFVNQYEYIAQVFDPVILNALGNCPKGGSCINGWGVTIQYPNYVPGPFPDTSPEKVVVKDVASWRDYVKAPPTKLPEEAWAPFIAQAEAVDRNEVFLAPFVAPGIFEKLHYLIGMEEAMMAFYEEPEAMAELIDYLADTYGDKIWFSLMSQYTPMGTLPFEELNRKVSRKEYEQAVDHVIARGIENCMIQEGDAAEQSFIPAFDGEGVLPE